jgi:hypothetical protein
MGQHQRRCRSCLHGLDFAVHHGLRPPFFGACAVEHFRFAQARSDQLDLVLGVAMV